VKEVKALRFVCFEYGKAGLQIRFIEEIQLQMRELVLAEVQS